MATRREVELIIKARDQAKQAVDGLIDSLQKFGKTQSDLSASGGALNSTLGALAREIRTLETNAKGFTALNRMASQLQRASVESQKLEAAAKASGAAMGEMSQRANSSAARLNASRAAVQAQAQAIDKQRAALRALVQEQERAQNTITQLGGYRQASIPYMGDKSVKTPIVARFDELRKNVTEAKAAISAAEREFGKLNREVIANEKALVRANREFEKAALAARSDAEASSRAAQAYQQLQASATQASTALGGVEVKQDAIAAASNATASAIARLSEALQRQRAAQQASAQAQTNNMTAFQRQQQAVEAARQAFRTAKEELARLKNEFAATQQPSAALSAELMAARVNAQLAGQAWREQMTSLDALRGKLREAAAAAQQKRNADREAAVAAAAAADAEFHKARADQTASVAARLLGRDTAQMAQQMRGIAGAARQGAESVRRFGDQSRRALSLVQRFRGEVLSLATSFAGLYGIINQTGQVIDALRTVEAAASRLTAVFDGDQSAVRAELRFLSQEADRLGLSFAVLSQEYGRFAIAADAANFSNDATRRIFISVAEAARVNKASVEELEGTFLALQQMVSKGTVSMEELRRQLGDRLPGAFNIFAEAIGVSTAELDKMLRAGEVRASETTLLKFAEELERRFGGALPAALETVTTQLDRFQNNLFEARARIAQGGFSDALEESLERLNEFFRSREGRDFFLEIGGLLASITRAVAFVVSNFELLGRVFQGFIALRVAQTFQGLLVSMRGTGAATTGLTASFLALDAAQQKQAVSTAAQVSASGALLATLRLLTTQAAATAVAIATTGVRSAATATAMAGLAAAARGVSIAFTMVLRSLGPMAIAAAAVFALSGMFFDMAKSVPDATRALDEHNRVLSEYEKEATAAERAGRSFDASLAGVSALEARGALEELRAAFGNLSEEAFKSAREIHSSWAASNRAFVQSEGSRAVSRLIEELRRGNITIYQFQASLREMADQLDGPSAGAVQGLIAHLIRVTDEQRKNEEAMVQAQIVSDRLSGTVSGMTDDYARFGIEVDAVTGRIQGLTNAMEEQARRATQINELRDQIIEGIPERAQAAERAAARAAIDDRAERVRAITEEGAERQELLGLIEEERAALEKKYREEDARDARRGNRRAPRDDQREFNRELERTIALRRFEIEQISRSRRDQEIEQAIYEARSRALQRNVQFTREQEAALREATAAAYDAAEAERVRLLVLDQEQALREALGERISVQAELENEARRQNIDMLTAEGQAWADTTRRIMERERAVEALKTQVEEVTALERQRQEAIEEFEAARAAGELNREQREQAMAEIERQRVNIEAARQAALELAVALGDEKAIARLERMNSKLSEQAQKVREIRTDLINMLSDGLTGAITTASEELGKAIDGTQKWSDALLNVGNAFRQFASDFLKEIAKMILQQAILNALQNSSGGWVGAISSAIGGMHDGGIAGRDRTFTRRVDPRIFSGAARFHNGGLPGLRRDEVPAILQKGEEVLTRDNPRHIMNQGGGGGDIRIINAIDPQEYLSQGLNSPGGTKAILNWMRANRQSVQGAIS